MRTISVDTADERVELSDDGQEYHYRKDYIFATEIKQQLYSMMLLFVKHRRPQPLTPSDCNGVACTQQPYPEAGRGLSPERNILK